MTALSKSNTSIQRSIELSIPDKIKAKLTQSEFRIVSVSIPSEKNPRICELDERRRLRTASTIVIKAETRLGSKDKDDLHQEALINEIDSDLMKFPNQTTLEIFFALEMGLDGEFAEKNVVIFSPSNFVIWVKSYIELKKKPAIKIFAQLNHQVDQVDYVPTIGETLLRKLMILRTALTKSGPESEGFQDYGGVVYSLLDQFEYLNLDCEAKWGYMQKANQIMLHEAVEAKDSGRVKLMSELMLSTKARRKDESVIATAQRLIVFDKLKGICRTLDDANDFLENVNFKVKEYIESLNTSPANAN
ncbi:hypothetical protein DYBT9623_04460 [Dyadobacter sp. CECT 9623]|uniref:Uncharacterized protein n=1 Tax=Dyadobacter linearis TaxID=2823330 RepID=A0ABN7RGH9_9BACT|nr:hypothetical protein [Dyadobacter sp. CECT 9623]CAG5072923.1 hypothetical protein DYBT9623_04460 [Dyadobacter sp. CECT 9623]